MTLIYTPRHMDQLVSEIKHDWPKNDPDMHRVADALPLEVIEAAYVRKLGTLQAAELPRRALTAGDKLSTLRILFRAWLRAPTRRLGQLLTSAMVNDRALGGQFEAIFHNVEDGTLAQLVQRRYPSSE